MTNFVKKFFFRKLRFDISCESSAKKLYQNAMDIYRPRAQAGGKLGRNGVLNHSHFSLISAEAGIMIKLGMGMNYQS